MLVRTCSLPSRPRAMLIGIVFLSPYCELRPARNAAKLPIVRVGADAAAAHHNRP